MVSRNILSRIEDEAYVINLDDKKNKRDTLDFII